MQCQSYPFLRGCQGNGADGEEECHGMAQTSRAEQGDRVHLSPGKSTCSTPLSGLWEQLLCTLEWGQSTHIVGMPWICMGVGCWIPFFFRPLRIAVREQQTTHVRDLNYSLSSPTQVPAAALPPVTNTPQANSQEKGGISSSGLPAGNFISLKLLMGGGMPSPSTRMWYFLRTRSCRASDMPRM